MTVRQLRELVAALGDEFDFLPVVMTVQRGDTHEDQPVNDLRLYPGWRLEVR